MPAIETNHEAILNAVGDVELISELLDRDGDQYVHELDLEIMVYGRNYNGKKVGPYVQLLRYSPGEIILRDGEPGKNCFYVSVDGRLDVYAESISRKLGEILPGTSFGEGTVLAGKLHAASVIVPPGREVRVLSIGRPALRLLRKLPRFAAKLDVTYRNHGLLSTLHFLAGQTSAFSPELLSRLGKASRFMVYGKHHVLCREGEPIDRLVFIRNGWVRRVRGLPSNAALTSEVLVKDFTEEAGLGFLGAGNCVGLGGVAQERRWNYTATILARTEVLEISIPDLRADPQLRDAVLGSFSDFSADEDASELTPAPARDALAAAATEQEISTGLVDATNLLVMDMDLCVRCGNCSLACHKVHGRSRLLRRGIHVERPVRLGSAATQHVLSPSVCMHCQDPECLTGCPTGAIGRHPEGRIDINGATCIGCGDCATQCPYNAISLIPRRREPTPPLKTRLRKWLTASSLSLPPPDTHTDDLVAINCNLCAGTQLNPPNARRAAYSCEENCPTGALLRVNPRDYFGEIKNVINPVYAEQTHAIGRNIHKSDPARRLWHAGGIVAAVVLTVWALRTISGVGWDLSRPALGNWLSARWLTGLVGLVCVAFVMAYPARKQVYRRRAGALRYWMQAHVYGGVVAGVVLLLHAANGSGGVFTSLLTISLHLTLLSGLFGVAAYVICPRLLTDMEESPMLIEDLRGRRAELRESLDKTVAAYPELRDILVRDVAPRFLTFRYLLRQYLKREKLAAALASAHAEFGGAAGQLKDLQSRRGLLEIVEAAVTLRRVDALLYLHLLLKLWVAPHVVATVLMLTLMLVHVVHVSLAALR